MMIIGFENSSQYPDVVFICEQVLELFSQKFPRGPVLGYKEINLVEAEVPRAVLNDLPEKYTVALTCLYSKRLNQIVYQFGHELLHVFINPYWIDPFVEVLACAASFCALDFIAQEWTKRAHLIAYAEKLRVYKDKIIANAWTNLNLVPNVDEEPTKIWCKSFQMTCDDRRSQLAAASLMAPLMEEMPSWHVFTTLQLRLKRCPDETPWRENIDLAKWKQETQLCVHCTTGEVKIIDTIAETFGLI